MPWTSSCCCAITRGGNAHRGRRAAAGRRLLAQAGELKAEAREFGQELAGAIAVGCFEVLAPYVLPELLATCAERHPGLRLDPYEVDLDTLAQGVISGRFELGLGYELAPDPRLVTSRVFTPPPYVLLAGHKLAGRSKVTLAQLAGEPPALLDLPQSRDYFLVMFAAAGVEPDIGYRSSVETLRALVGRELAYTLLNLQPAVATSLDGHPVVSLAREAARRCKSYWSPPPAAAAPRRSPR